MKLRTKTSLVMAVIIIAVLGITGGSYLYFLENSLRHSIYNGLESITDTSSQAIARFLEDTQREALAVAMALDKRALEERDVAAIEEKLKKIFEIFPKFENGMFLLDTEGKLWVDYPMYQRTRGVDLSFRPYFQKTMEGQAGIISAPYRSVRTGNPVLTFTSLLRGTSGQVLGILGCSVQLNSPLALEGIRLTKIGTSGFIYAFDTSRLLIIYPDSERILKRDVKPGANRLFDAAIEGFEGVGETVDSQGVPMLVSFKHVPLSDWIVAAQQPLSEAFAPIRAARERMMYGIIIAVFVTVLIVFFVVRGITGPIYRLRSATLFFDAENPESHSAFIKELERISGSQGNEISDLAVAFMEVCSRLNKTMVSLRDYARDWERTFNSVSDAIFILDRDNRIIRINRSAAILRNMKEEDAVGQSFYKLMHGIDRQPDYYPSIGDLVTGTPHVMEVKGMMGNIFMLTLTPLVHESGEIVGTVCTAMDITEQKKAGDILRKRERELKIKTRNLEEANVALKVLLKHKDEHKAELEESVLDNVRKLVLPYVEQLKRTNPDVKQTAYLEIIESNLNQIIAPSSQHLSSVYFNLTPREIQVANLIKDGKTNKDMAELLNLSLRAIEFYRENIRKKLGLTHKKLNLKSHLQTYKG